MKKIWKALGWFVQHWLVAIITISVIVTIVTFICGVENFHIVGMLTFMGLGGLVILFTWLRQLWWWITSTGDYEKDNTKK